MVRAVEAVSPSVVNITVVKQVQGGVRSPFGDPFSISSSRNFTVSSVSASPSRSVPAS